MEYNTLNGRPGGRTKGHMTKTLQHIALIPDGNRRWARAHGLPILTGHAQVTDHVIPDLVRTCIQQEIPYFTVWAFSTENWGRDQAEVTGLMDLFAGLYDKFAARIAAQNVRVTFIGRRDNLSPALQDMIARWTEDTKLHTGLTFTIALNYGGHDDILRAVNKIIAEKRLSEIGDRTLRDYLDTSVNDLPDPDLIIRPGGEKRLSGFMSWQGAYSELYFSDKMMPDFGPDDLRAAIADFHDRQRRFGK
ncbi:di-trans,poly-cis-decaprenylcistransferase [bacterium]|nr:di-trans,poly-cis-decaprenylcistransferase [bacterium]